MNFIPKDFKQYQRLSRNLGVVLIAVLIWGVIFYYIFKPPDLLKEPIKFIICFFTIAVPLVGITVFMMICPQCGKFPSNPINSRSQGADSSLLSAEKFLKTKKCRHCGFTFKEAK